jgi:hypothetical protein
MHRGEVILADKAYVGEKARRAGLVAPFKKRDLSDYEKHFNVAHRYLLLPAACCLLLILTFDSDSWFRATVEHFFGHLKRFQAVGGRHRGRMYMDKGRLYQITHICVCILGLRIDAHPLRTHKVRHLALPIAPLVVEDAEQYRDVVVLADAAVESARRAMGIIDANGEHKIDDPNMMEAKRGLEWGDSKHDMIEVNGNIRGIGDEPHDGIIDTHRTSVDFTIGDRVAAWWWGKWWKCTIHYVARATVTLRWDHDGGRAPTSGYKPRLVIKLDDLDRLY